MATPAPAYTQITSFFNSNPGTRLHVEFHPTQQNTTPTLLISSTNIAIPKTLLLQAFQTARATFASPTATPQEILDSSLVLLLIASENLTAVNARRRIILDQGARKGREEIRLVESFLTSPLNKHNKSPLLWGYKRWLTERFCVPERGVEEEMDVVEVSGQVHPRNYYAWNYARFVVAFFLPRITPTPTPTPTADPPQLVGILVRTTNWALRHVSDTSVWSFLQFLFFHTLEQTEPHSFRDKLGEIVSECMRWVHGIARGHESAWVFLRTVLASRELLDPDRREKLVGTLKGWVQEDGVDVEEARREREMEKKALEWIGRRMSR